MARILLSFQDYTDGILVAVDLLAHIDCPLFFSSARFFPLIGESEKAEEDLPLTAVLLASREDERGENAGGIYLVIYHQETEDDFGPDSIYIVELTPQEFDAVLIE